MAGCGRVLRVPRMKASKGIFLGFQDTVDKLHPLPSILNQITGCLGPEVHRIIVPRHVHAQLAGGCGAGTPHLTKVLPLLQPARSSQARRCPPQRLERVQPSLLLTPAASFGGAGRVGDIPTDAADAGAQGSGLLNVLITKKRKHWRCQWDHQIVGIFLTHLLKTSVPG